ncbi:MAG: thioesterase family protein [Pseudomonadota bacterium]
MSVAAGGGPDRVTYRGTVYPWHCDHMGHMNVMWYVGKFDEATWSLLHRLGITPAYLRENGRGMVAVDQHLEYKRELQAGDIVTVRSRIVELHAKKVRFQHEMVNDGTGEVSAVTTLIGVHLDTATRRACPFPEDLLAQVRASGW